MRLVTSITHLGLNEVGAASERIEAAGIDGVSTQENKHDPYLPLAFAATNTRQLGLRTSIAIAFSRSPMPVAMSPGTFRQRLKDDSPSVSGAEKFANA